MDKVGVDQIIEKAAKAWEAAKSIRDSNRREDPETKQLVWTDKQYKASYETAFNEAMTLKEKADEALAEYKRDQKAEQLDSFFSESGGKIPGMAGVQKAGGLDRAADSWNGAEVAQVRYKAMPYGREVKVFNPTGNKNFKAADEAAYAEVFRTYMFDPEEWRRTNDDQRDLARRKALSVGLDSAGGALVASEVFIATLIEALEDAVIMRQLATVLPPLTTATSLAVGTAGDLDDASWTAEIESITMDTAAPFGARRLTPHQLAKGIKISEPLIRLSRIDVEAWARGELVNRFAAPEERAFMIGSGSQQPEGLYTSALTTTVTTASATAIDYPDLVAMTTALKKQYRAGASWIMHRIIIGEINLLVDGIGRPLLREMPNAGINFQLLGYALNESEYSPSVSSTGLKVAALGNYKRAYRIVDSLALTVKRINEVYDATNEIGYHARKETDGMVVDGNGVNILTMA